MGLVEVDGGNLHFREMVRQQLAGDREHAQEIIECHGSPGEVGDRLVFVTSLAVQLGLAEALAPVGALSETVEIVT